MHEHVRHEVETIKEETSGGESPRGMRIFVARDDVQDPLGLSLDLCDGRLLYLYGLRPGMNAATDHNASQPEQRQLRPGDYVLDVNGIRGNARAMMKEREHSAQLHLITRRPLSFEVEIHKMRGILGLGLHHSSRSNCLLVEAILDGPA